MLRETTSIHSLLSQLIVDMHKDSVLLADPGIVVASRISLTPTVSC